MRLLIPNFHVALIHFPIALLAVGVMIELVCSFAWRASGARLAGGWMILFAALLGWPTVYSGAYAIRTAAGEDFANQTWEDIRAGSPRLSDPAAWETLRTHLIVNASAVAITSVVVVGWLMMGARARHKFHWACLALLLLANAGAGFGAWAGGELVYWHDVTHVKDSPGPEMNQAREVSFAPTSVLPPLDAHVTTAGFATGIALLAWGVAARSRRAVVAVDPGTGAPLPAEADGLGESPYHDPQRDRIFAAFQPATVEVVAVPPTSALGWLAALAFAAAAVLGLWSIADGWGSWSPHVLLGAIIDADNAVGSVSRRLAHFVGGALVMVLAIAVGVGGAHSRGGRVLPMIIGFVLLLALVAQAWLGVLLLLDTNAGPLTGLNV